MKLMTMNKFMNMNHMTMKYYELYEPNFIGSKTFHEYGWYSVFLSGKSIFPWKPLICFCLNFFYGPKIFSRALLIFFAGTIMNFFMGGQISVLLAENWFSLLSTHMKLKFFFFRSFQGQNLFFSGTFLIFLVDIAYFAWTHFHLYHGKKNKNHNEETMDRRQWNLFLGLCSVFSQAKNCLSRPIFSVFQAHRQILTAIFC